MSAYTVQNSRRPKRQQFQWRRVSPSPDQRVKRARKAPEQFVESDEFSAWLQEALPDTWLQHVLPQAPSEEELQDVLPQLPNEDEGFISFQCQEDSEDDSEDNAFVACDGKAPVAAVKPQSDSCSITPEWRPLFVDLTVSDLSLEMDDAGVASARFGEDFSQAWTFGRGTTASFAGRTSWRLHVVQLSTDLTPSFIAGWLAVPPGSAELPQPQCCHELQTQPELAAVASTGDQCFTSNTSPKLLQASLLPRALAVGDILDVVADVTQRRAWFRVNHGPTVEARRLPAPDKRASGARFQETAYYPFFAIRGSTQIKVLQGSAGPGLLIRTIAGGNKSVPEAVLLAGPPGAGKTTWAVRHASATCGVSIHMLSAEWWQHRLDFAKDLCHSSISDNGTAGTCEECRPPMPQELLALLAANSVKPTDFKQEDYWIEGHGWDIEGILDDIEIAQSRSRKHSYESSQRVCQTLAKLLPELLRRAAVRGAAVLADGCHLHAPQRAALRAALVKYPGRVRWVVILPKTLEELQRRRAARDHTMQAPDEYELAELPGSHEGSFRVEFAEGADVSIFTAWRQSCTSSNGHLSVEGAESDTPAAFTARLEDDGVQSFFNAYGNGQVFLSTGGTRVL